MDAYLILTPLLVLGIIGLIRFIGCDVVLGLDSRTPKPAPVEDLQALERDTRVTLSWSYPSTGLATSFRIEVDGEPFEPEPPLDASARLVDVTGLTNGIQYSFTVIGEKGTDASTPETISATPGVTSFVVDKDDQGEPKKIVGVERVDYSALVGMEIMVGSKPVIVTQLGRIIGRANSRIHEVKIVSPVTTPVGLQPVAGTVVVSADVTTVAQPDQGNVGTFAWTPLPQPVRLEANTPYFIVSSETAGLDLWYNEQPLETTAVAALRFSIYTLVSGADAGKYGRNMPDLCYVPVSFRY